MILEGFQSTPEDFHDRPIRLPILGTTGLPKGDDRGYRDDKDVRVEESGERVVALNDYVLVRPFYEGVSPYTGEVDQSLVLPGGTGSKMYARETVAVGAGTASEYVSETYGDDFAYGVIDAFRSERRQAADFTRQLIIELKGDAAPDIRKLFETGLYTDLTVSFVYPDKNSQEFKDVLRDVLGSPEIMDVLEDTVRTLHEQNAAAGVSLDKDDAKREIATRLITICANVTRVKDFFGEKAPRLPINNAIPLDFNKNAHAGAAALDGFIFVDGKPITHVPYNQVGPVAARDFLERDENFAGFCEQVKQDKLLSIHLQNLGINPNAIDQADWEFFKQVQRIRHGVMEAMGATFYSSSDPAPSNPFEYKNPVDGGEVWHDEFGNMPMHPRTGEIVHSGGFADKYPQSGNPGHALQTMGRGRAVAVWGGIGAHQQLKELGVLDI